MKTALFTFLLFFAFGCEILEEDISADRVQVLSPADRIAVAPGVVGFRWQTLTYATGYEFTLVAPSFDRTERIVADTVIYADSLGRRFGCELQLAEGDYQWSLTAFNGGYVSQTEVRSLTVRSDPAQ